MNTTPRTLEEIAIEKARLKDEELKVKAAAKAFKEAEKQRIDLEKKIASDIKAEERKKKADAVANDKAERQINQKVKQAEKEELSDKAKFREFHNALKVYDSTEMNFFLDKTPQYFRKLKTSKVNIKSKKTEITTEIVYNTHNSLYPCWTGLMHPFARDMFRRMIGGEEIRIFNPESEDFESFTFPSRVYEKLVNTVDQVDEKTFNILDLSNVMKPNYVKDTTQVCPILHRALYFALSGNTIKWDTELNDWVGDKPENLEFMEKWTYGIVCANIGNNMLPMPIIYGAGKVGKNAAFEIVIPTILGAELAFVGTWDTVDSGFNAFKLGKVFVFVDEIPERSEWNKVKNATGSLKEYIKTKYGPEFQVDNCVAYAMGSNSTLFPLPFEEGKQMIRVSPIKVVNTSTFADNAYKMLNQARGADYCRQLMFDNGMDPKEMTDFEVGDALLKTLLASEWQTRESSQQFLNYLDQKYVSNRYHLTPLRGQDWAEIAEYKKDAVKATAEFVIAHNPAIISTHEIYEIYKVIQNERNSSVSKQLNSVTENIREYMATAGYIYTKDAVIHGGIRTNIFRRPDLIRGELKDYEENFSNYIADETQNGKPLRRLRDVSGRPELGKFNIQRDY